jgi:hypothetical protein
MDFRWPFSRRGVLVLCALACGGGADEVETLETEISPLAASRAGEDAAALPECGSVGDGLPELTNLLLTDASAFFTDEGDFSIEPIVGRAFVRDFDERTMRIEGESCCAFELQRLRGVPAFARVGDELEFSLRYVPAFNPEWTLMLREPGGRLLYFRHSGRFDAQRQQLMGAPFDIQLEAACWVPSACYSTTQRLLVTVASETDRVTLSGRQRGMLEIDGASYQVLDHVSASLSGSSICDDPPPPGDHLTLEVLPANVPL